MCIYIYESTHDWAPKPNRSTATPGFRLGFWTFFLMSGGWDFPQLHSMVDLSSSLC